jgi:hypothetical protein
VKLSLVTFTTLAALTLPAFADPVTPQEKTATERFAAEGMKHFDYTRFVPAGVKRTVGYGYGANIDCSPMTDIDVRVTKEPEHGAVELVSGEFFPAFAKDNPRVKCNDKKIRGMKINYTATKGYMGDDTFQVLILFPNGFAYETDYNITVK